MILQVVRGDLDAFELIFREFYKPLVRYGNTFLRDGSEVEDVVQHVFISFWEKREEIKIHTSVRSMLYTSVRNTCLNRLKHLKVRKEHEVEVLHTHSEGDESDLTEFSELSLQLEQAIGKMPEQCGRIFRMSRFEQLRYQEIADELGISIKTVENQMGKALKIAREHLKDYLPLLILFLIQEL